MNLPHIVNAVMCEPWCILPSAHASIREIVSTKLLTGSPPERKPGTDICGDEISVQSMQVAGGLAIIPVSGVLARKVPAFARGSVTDFADVIRDVEWARTNDSVQAVLFDVDSPGGMSMGTPELASVIVRLSDEKPTYTYTGGLMCSAAYWAGSQTGGIFATQSAEVGAIGAYIAFLDTSAALAAGGLFVDVVSSGPLKGAGIRGTSLTPEQRNFMQASVDATTAEFLSAVMSKRHSLDSKLAVAGGYYSGQQAVKLGFVDQIVGGIGEVVSLLGFDFSAFAETENNKTK